MIARRTSEGIYRYRHVGQEENVGMIQCIASDGIRYLLIMNGKLCDRTQIETTGCSKRKYRKLYEAA